MDGNGDDSFESPNKALDDKHDATASKGMSMGTVSAPIANHNDPDFVPRMGKSERDHKRQVKVAIKRLRALLSNLEDINSNDAIDLESWYRIVVGQLHESSVANEEFATRIASTGINCGIMSKRAAAEKLHVHPHTLDRRLKEERFIGMFPAD